MSNSVRGGQSPLNLDLMRLTDAAFLECPYYGARQITRMGLSPIYQKRCADIPMRRGFLYLVAVMDWATRKVLAWRLANTDPGSQFTSPRFTDVPKDARVRISMDGRGRGMDNVFIEHLWRSMKYECVYLSAFETGSELRDGLTRWIAHYDAHRPHSALGGHTPGEAYHQTAPSPWPGHAPA